MRADPLPRFAPMESKAILRQPHSNGSPITPMTNDAPNLRFEPTGPRNVRLSEVISAMSYALDIVEGQPEGHAIRSCLLGMRIAEELGLKPEQRSALFYALLLKDLGCASNAAKICYLFGADDHDVKRDFKTTDWPSFVESAKYVLRNVAPGGSLWEKARHAAALVIGGPATAKQLVKIRCERGALIARSLDLPEDTVQAIRNLDEHWDGHGHPDGLRKKEIPLLARILGISQTIEVYFTRDGLNVAMDIAKERSGTWFDPTLVKALKSIRKDTAFWEQLASDVPRQHLDAYEPEDRVMSANDEMLDKVCRAFGQVIDAKSPWTMCHSQGVSDIAVGIATELQMSPYEITRIGRAGLLHDVGKLGVSNKILDKPGKLTEAEFDELKLHPAQTLRILERVECFADFAEIAASHHERLDGKGYHRGLDASQLCTSARILTVSDMYEALAAKRPYRKDLSDGEVHDILKRGLNTAICPVVYDALCSFLKRTGYVTTSLAA